MMISQHMDSLNIKQNLAKILDKYSSEKLSNTEIQSFYNRDKNVKHCLKSLEKFREDSASSEELFMSSISAFMNSTLQSDKDEFHQIMLVYLLLISSHIVDIFNTQGLKDKKKHIKNIKKLFLDSTLNVITTYESELLKTIKKINQNLDDTRVPSSTLNKQELKKAIELHQNGDFDKAESIYKSILKVEKDNFDALQLLGGIALKKEQWHNAIELFNKAIFLAPNYAQAYSNRGIALTELNLLDKALESYNLAITIKPNYANAHYGKGMILRKLKHLDEALQSYEKAIELEPNNAEYFFKQGVLLNELKQFDEAIKSYQMAINIDTNNPDAYYNIGNILKELEEFDEARTNYDKAVSLQPNYANAYYNLGVVLNELKQFDEALINYDKAISIQPNLADITPKSQ